MVDYFERHKKSLAAKQEHYHKIERRLDEMIRQQQETRAAMKNQVFEIEEKTVDSMRISGVRMKGRYSDCSRGFSQIGASWGGISGVRVSCCTMTTNTRKMTWILKRAFRYVVPQT